MAGPWAKFYWSDYRGDPALNLCSLAAQGLWMQMLCIAADADPIGYLVVNSRPLGATDLARLTGASEAEVTGLLNELALNGVFSRDAKARIYNRRMVRDARVSALAKKNGKLGGNPNLSETTENSEGVNPQDNHTLKPKKLEARSQKEKPEAKASVKKTALPADVIPDDEMLQYAQEQGVEDARREFDAFCDHHRARNNRFSDWPAAWRTWCRNAVKFARERRPGSGGQRSGSQGGNSISRAAMAVADSYRQRGLRTDGVSGDGTDRGTGAAGHQEPLQGFDEAGRPGADSSGDWEVLAPDKVA